MKLRERRRCLVARRERLLHNTSMDPHRRDAGRWVSREERRVLDPLPPGSPRAKRVHRYATRHGGRSPWEDGALGAILAALVELHRRERDQAFGIADDDYRVEPVPAWVLSALRDLYELELQRDLRSSANEAIARAASAFVEADERGPARDAPSSIAERGGPLWDAGMILYELSLDERQRESFLAGRSDEQIAAFDEVCDGIAAELKALRRRPMSDTRFYSALVSDALRDPNGDKTREMFDTLQKLERGEPVPNQAPSTRALTLLMKHEAVEGKARLAAVRRDTRTRKRGRRVGTTDEVQDTFFVGVLAYFVANGFGRPTFRDLADIAVARGLSQNDPETVRQRWRSWMASRKRDVDQAFAEITRRLSARGE